MSIKLFPDASAFERDASALNTRPAAPVEGLEEIVKKAMQDEWEEICADTDCHPLDIEQLGRRRLRFSPNHWASAVAASVRSQSEAIIAAKDEIIKDAKQSRDDWKKLAKDLQADNTRLRDSSETMATDPDEWTATEEVLAHLLINVVGVPDDVTYTPDEAQGIIEKSIKGMEADNAALTARFKELETELGQTVRKLNCDNAEQFWKAIGKFNDRAEALETQLAAAKKALARAAYGFDQIHKSLMGNGPKQASGEVTAFFLAETNVALEAKP